MVLLFVAAGAIWLYRAWSAFASGFTKVAAVLMVIAFASGALALGVLGAAIAKNFHHRHR
jgi:hypothetical protein